MNKQLEEIDKIHIKAAIQKGYMTAISDIANMIGAENKKRPEAVLVRILKEVVNLADKSVKGMEDVKEDLEIFKTKFENNIE